MMRRQKKTFISIFSFLTILLATLPFLLTFNEILTHFVESIKVYGWIQKFIVPVQIKMVGVLVRPFGINYAATGSTISINGHFAALTWNCLGWQSLLLLMITLIAAFREGQYTFLSKVEAVVIGLTGTFLINLFRISFIVMLLAFLPNIFSVVYHDYLAAITTVVWLFGFWWFCYAYVLEERQPSGVREK